MTIAQIPDPPLLRDLGVLPYLFVVVTVAGLGAMSFFLRRITQAMDRMADAQERAPVIMAELKTLFVERMDQHDKKLDRAVALAEEHVQAARMWERTEAPGRQVREGGA